MLFSEDLKPLEGNPGMAVRACIDEITAYFGIAVLPVLAYDAYSVAIPVTFKVSLPIRGAVDIDIRAEEPVLIRIFLSLYPYTMPVVMSDRKDFPRKQLSHLYAGNEDQPAKLCLVRNSSNEWFANKTVASVLDETATWLFKAGAGILTGDGGEWDPMRPENYWGSHAYSYEMVRDIVSGEKSFIPGDSFAFLFGYVREEKDSDPGGRQYRSIHEIPFIANDKIIPALEHASAGLRQSLGIIPVIPILIWQPDGIIDPDYYTGLPNNYGRLKAYFRARGIDLNQVLNVYIKAGCKFLKGIPVIYAVKRPAKLIGYDGRYEFINFLHSVCKKTMAFSHNVMFSGRHGFKD